MLHIVWFKRDLRVADHAPLAEAAAAGPVLPLYVAEPDYWRLNDVSPRQWAFTRGAVQDLAARLAAMGAPLVVRVGDVVEVLEALRQRHGALALHSHEETGNLWTFARDRRVAAWACAHGVAWSEHAQFGVRRRMRDRNHWARFFARRMEAPIIATPARLHGTDEPVGRLPEWARDDGLTSLQPPGRAAAVDLLDSFFAGRGADYRRGMSSPISGERACSRLSPHLAMGSLSMREAVQRAAAELVRADPVIARGNAQSLLSRLHWHCHFIQKLESEPELERRAAHSAAEAARRSTAPDDPRLLAWAQGRTGLPFLDACMRSLIATGWLNFRMRAMVQAVASYHLALDWQASGTRLARLFTDYEPGIHWPQVQMQSGATGINTPRIYNPIKQGLDQDPDAVFIARWVPEVASLAPPMRHMPWLAGGAVPIVEVAEAARAAKVRISAMRAEPGFQVAARGVFERHGSRARTFGNDHPVETRARAAQKAAKASRQAVLDF